MDKVLLEKLIIEDRTNTFEEVLDCVYSMLPYEENRVIEIAEKINKKIGNILFENLSYKILIKEFSIIARAIQINALNSM